MPVRLVALDLDDTLLSPDLTISDRNAAAVRATLDAGVYAILASGRTIESMLPYAERLGMRGRGLPMICANGSEVRDIDSGTVERRVTIPSDVCLIAIEALAEHGLPVQTYEDGAILVTESNRWAERDRELTGLPIRLVPSIHDIASEPRSKLLSAGTPERVAETVPLLRERLAGLAEVVVSKPYFLEILPAGSGKGDALAWVAQSLGIARDDVMAVGDAGNDLGMVSWAGYGCAPADAIPEILAAARYRSPLPHDKGAVAELLERLVLGGSGLTARP